MARNVLPYFPFHAADYLNDAAVMGMDADAEGCYIRLLARSWGSETPGKIPTGLLPEMSGIARLAEQYRFLWADKRAFGIEVDVMSTSPENLGADRVGDVMQQMMAAFDTESEPGCWLQRRMIAEYRRLTGTRKAQVTAARNTNAVRKIERSPSRLAHRSPPRSPGVEVEVEVDSERYSAKPLTPFLPRLALAASNGASEPGSTPIASDLSNQPTDPEAEPTPPGGWLCENCGDPYPLPRGLTPQRWRREYGGLCGKCLTKRIVHNAVNLPGEP